MSRGSTSAASDGLFDMNADAVAVESEKIRARRLHVATLVSLARVQVVRFFLGAKGAVLPLAVPTKTLEHTCVALMPVLLACTAYDARERTWNPSCHNCSRLSAATMLSALRISVRE